jgi:predicted RNA-binding Zn-ribbon protein involved in translation (DUF1610 family)
MTNFQFARVTEMIDFPRSLTELEQRFGDEAACAEYLAEARWPHGFACPACGGNKAWQLESKSWTYECARCGRQTSVTAGTIMHHSKLPLTTWFWAAWVMATQPNGISASQLQRELALGSYKTAWLLCAKLRRSMVELDRSLLSGMVEVDQTEIPCRSKNDAAAGGRGTQRKMLVVCAVAVEDLRRGRIRLSALPDYSADSLGAFLATHLAPDATVKTNRDPDLVAAAPARVTLPWVRRAFADLGVWALGVYHGLRRKHLQSYLDEFAFRFNRRRARDAAFASLLGAAAAHAPVSYNMLVSREAAA